MFQLKCQQFILIYECYALKVKLPLSIFNCLLEHEWTQTHTKKEWYNELEHLKGDIKIDRECVRVCWRKKG